MDEESGSHHSQIETGGAYIDGNISTEGGDLSGRDLYNIEIKEINIHIYCKTNPHSGYDNKINELQEQEFIRIVLPLILQAIQQHIRSLCLDQSSRSARETGLGNEAKTKNHLDVASGTKKGYIISIITLPLIIILRIMEFLFSKIISK